MADIKRGTVVQLDNRTSVVLSIDSSFDAWSDKKTVKVLLTDGKELFYVIREINTFTGKQVTKTEHVLWINERTLSKLKDMIKSAPWQK